MPAWSGLGVGTGLARRQCEPEVSTEQWLGPGVLDSFPNSVAPDLRTRGRPLLLCAAQPVGHGLPGHSAHDLHTAPPTEAATHQGLQGCEEGRDEGPASGGFTLIGQRRRNPGQIRHRG